VLGLVVAVCGLFIAGMMAATSYVEPAKAGGMDSFEMLEFGQVSVYRDNRTGCHYISRGAGSLQPRLYSDGSQVCD
jgi:hypothetical protein